jgi:hypothetical protein
VAVAVGAGAGARRVAQPRITMKVGNTPGAASGGVVVGGTALL